MSAVSRTLISAVSALALSLTLAPAAQAFGSASAPGTAPAATAVTADVANLRIAADPDLTSGPTGAFAQIRQEILDLTNAERARHSAPPVRHDPVLERIAQQWSAHMASVDRMYHNPDLATVYPSGWTALAENVLQNWDDASAAALVQQWINSPPHHAAMINPVYTHLGIGYAVTPEGKVFATQNYVRY